MGVDGSVYRDRSGNGVRAVRDAPFANIVIQPASTALGATGNSDDYYTAGKGLDAYINITGSSGTSPTLAVTLQGKDPVSGQYFTLLASAATGATSFVRLQVAPGIPAAANLTANIQLPPIWRVLWTIGGSATPIVTCSISVTPLA